ncbi:hypothetical protein [Paenibacillus sp. Soil724D2]|uniref:hypothetical protein n=1 Tax=Paenibacillus sp. (strain Soil724D2) TaxID=1736392 RepID=UPI0007138A23|nr:hypothetical protein [Paenibacillus sp. Soil724D2]KRE48440.1 hypothetical protein ASG85_05405 [Paenibacillus sp. Soil724D2]
MSIKSEQESTRLSDTKHKILPAIRPDEHKKLQLLALACSIHKTQLSAEIIEMAVNNPEIIKWFQDKYKVSPNDRVIPIRSSDGNIQYKRGI